MRRWMASIVVAGALVTIAVPTQSLALGPAATAQGSGVDGLGNRLTVNAGESFFTGGGGIAFVRLADARGPATVVVLTCVIIDTRPGFRFMYSSGLGSDGHRWFIGVFDDSGPGRTGPYDVMYTQTKAVNGPCGVASGSSYPIGWDPVSQGDFVVQ